MRTPKAFTISPKLPASLPSRGKHYARMIPTGLWQKARPGGNFYSALRAGLFVDLFL